MGNKLVSKIKKIKLLFLFIVIFLTQLAMNKCQAQPERLSEAKDKEIIEMISNVKPPAPEENARYLLYEEDYSVEKDGRVTRKMHAVIKIFREEGRGFGDVSISYNAYYETYSIKLARTIQKDGTFQRVSQEAIQEKTPFADYPLYSSFKVLEFSFPAIKPESVIEYIIVIEDKKPIIGRAFSLYYTFSWDTLFSLAKLKIHLPKEMEGKFIVRGAFADVEKNPAIEIKGNKTIYLWEFRNFLQVRGWEPLRPPDREVGAVILFTTIKSWDEVANWAREMTKGQESPDGKIISVVKDLILTGAEEKIAKEELIKKAFYFVSQKVRYVAIELGISAWKPYKAGDVLSNLYGDCKGKATLLISMLKALGVKSYYALVRTKNSGNIVSDIPSPFDFNHCIVAIPEGEGFLFLDPTPEFIKYSQLPSSDQGVEALVITDEDYKLVRTPELDFTENFTLSSTNIKIKRDSSADIFDESQKNGIEDLITREIVKYSDRYTREDAVSRFLSSSYPGGGKLLEFETSDINDFEKPLKITMHYQINNYLRKTDNKFTFRLPTEELVELRHVIGGEYRKYPVWFPYAFSAKKECIIEFPEDYKVESLPEDINLDFPFASYSYSAKLQDNKIYINTASILKTRELSSGKFGRFKNMVDKIFEHASKEITLTEKDKI